MKQHLPRVSPLALSVLLMGSSLAFNGHCAEPAPAVVDNLSFNGQVDQDQASFILKGRLKGTVPDELETKLIYSLQLQSSIQIEPKSGAQSCELKARVIQGKLREIILALRGDGEVSQVTGSELKDWSVRVGAQGKRFLVIRPLEPATNAPPLTNFAVTVSAHHKFEKLPAVYAPLSFIPENAAFSDGSIEIKPADTVALSITNLTGLSVLSAEAPDGPERGLLKDQPIRFRFSGAEYVLSLEVREKDPDARKVAWNQFKLVGNFQEQTAAFVLTGEAVVKHPEGGILEVLSGDAALTSYSTNAELSFDRGRYWLRFRRAGLYPLELKFNAKVTSQDGWNSLSFEVVASSLRPLVLQGLSADTQFQFPGAAKPERQGDVFLSFLPSAGKAQLQWKEAKTEEQGKLFYAVQGIDQISVGPGLLRQVHWLEFKVMQGELNQLVFDLAGDGEVTRIRGDDILAWKVEGTSPSQKRRLVVQLNQARQDRYRLVIQTQTPLGIFPLQIQPLRLVPTQAIRYGGHLMVLNDGAVRLEVIESRGLSQISPELFPQNKELAEFAPATRGQAFAYRFSGGDYALRIQADNILPELTVSQMLVYRLGETETAIDAEIELDIREAPLREFYLRVPADFTVSRLNAVQLGDYSLVPDTDPGWSRLKMIFTSPLTGRQLIQLGLEKSLNAIAGRWTLPVMRPLNVKATRGYVGVSADTGFRLTPVALEGLTEVASAFFPKKIAGLQAAYRLRDENWQAAMNVERLDLSIQADATHLFTASEGLAYGSSVINYFVSGTPISMLKLSAPAEYSNIEFTGRDVRNWKQTGTNYEVYLQAPIFGAYTLLATFDEQFNAQTNTLSFAGIRPTDVQSEQGTVLVVSQHQIEVKPVEISAGVLQLDPGEIAPEHRLMFDAPILAAYQYTSRPFALRLALQSLKLGETVHQVADRAALATHVSREGEVMTEAQYFLKSQGQTHLRLTLPSDGQLWEANVNGKKVVPVSDRQETLIPLPTETDANALLKVVLKLAAKSPDKKSIRLAMPALAVPVLFTDWRVTPDEGYRVLFKGGTINPTTSPANRSGLAWLGQAWMGQFGGQWQQVLVLIPSLLLLGVLLLRWATRESVYRWTFSHLLGTGVGVLAGLASIALLAALMVFASAHPLAGPTELTLSAPIQEPGLALSLQVSNLEIERLSSSLWTAWPIWVGLLVWLYVLIRVSPGNGRQAGWLLGWTLIGWGALRLPDGAPLACGMALAFAAAHLLMPAWRCQGRVPRRLKRMVNSVAGPAAALLLFSVLDGNGRVSGAEPGADEAYRSTIESVIQQARVQDNVVLLKAVLLWKTETNQHLDFLGAPAVLTQIEYPQSTLQLSEGQADGKPVYRLTAKEAGEFTIRFQYQLPIQRDNAGTRFTLPTPGGLVNRVELEIEKADAEVYSASAVAINASHAKRQEADVTRADVILTPAAQATIGWKPRGRDTSTEKAVFYAELYHLFIPTAGIVEGVHEVQVRPAQGQLAEVAFQIPPALTITDVQADSVLSWRFDPDQRRLRVQFNAAQARPFVLRLRSQLATSPLPYQQTNGIIALLAAAGQVGMVGIGTGPEVELNTVKEDNLSAINLEDFPAALVAEAAKQIPGLTLRRAFRYAEPTAKVILAATAVQPDVRVETQETLSLGEDRTVLASQLTVHIARAGIFKLSFTLPHDFEVESLTGPALSHWTELKAGSPTSPASALSPERRDAENVSAGERIITMNLRGKTEGDQVFSISLVGPGVGTRPEGQAPRLVLREASKQTGQLVIVPELGIRLHIKTRDGLTQFDPKKAGVQQKGVLAFRLLHAAWQLGFDIENVEPWIQASSLQDVTVREGQVLVAAQFDYQIENAGLKSLSLRLPVRAENVHFEGDLISDSARAAGGTNQWIDWDLKLQRRVIGNYPLRITYQLTVTNPTTGLTITGIKARNANLQRGYLSIRTTGRLQSQFPQVPAALQRTEWQSIPLSLRRGHDLTESKDAFSILETDFALPLILSRHEVAQVLPARVESVAFTSVVALSGEMLTEGRLLLHPSDKRLLRLRLPVSSQFWYAFVNGQSAWPWREGDQILLLLEKNSDPTKPAVVDFFYTCRTSGQRAPGFTHQLLGPSLDLPLENITWRVYVPASWNVKDWESSLQLRSESTGIPPAMVDLSTYLQTETARQKEKSREAESLLLMGNGFLQNGAPLQARRAYQAAWRLSSQDAAFNEDARVQLHTLKLQQALLGLNQRRLAAFDFPDKQDSKSAKSPFTRWTPGQSPDYTQQQAQKVLEQNPAEDNSALVRLAERLISQQEASAGKAEGIRATLPAQGKLLTFTGSLQVESWANLQVKLDARPKSSRHWIAGILLLAAAFASLTLLTALSRDPAKMAAIPSTTL